MLGQLERPGRVVVADLEAGLGTLLRLDRPVHVVVVVVEPTAKSLDVGRRAVQTVRAAGLGRVVVTANRVRDEADTRRVHEAFAECGTEHLEVVVVPDDPAVVDAERRGVAPLDAAPGAPAMTALTDLASSLVGSGPR